MRILIVFIFLLCNGCQSNHFSDAMLEQFFALDKNLAENNKMVAETASRLFSQMQEHSRYRAQYDHLVEQAKKAIEITQNFHNHIDTLRNHLIAESGGFYSKEAAQEQGDPELEDRPIGGKDYHTPQRILVWGDKDNSKEAEGLILQKKILNLQDTFIAIAEEMWTNQVIKESIFAFPDKKAPAIEKLKTEMPFYALSEMAKNKDWVASTFEKMPLAAVSAKLRKMQNDAEITKLAFLKFLYNETGCRIVYMSEINHLWVIEVPTKTTIRLGETYEADILYGTYSAGIPISVSIDNQPLEIKNGRANFKIKPTAVGEKKYTAKVEFKNPFSRKTEILSKDFYYVVSR